MANVNSAGATQRIAREITNIQRNTDLSLAVAVRDEDIRHVRALIVGPPETPYEFGFFEFEVHFAKGYPLEAPAVQGITTNGGRTRFNPNIYTNGKVCLSILGTWRGESNEEWSAAQGLESVLLSIQSLLSTNPFENEPGFEEYKLSDPAASGYARKIRHETLRISVVERLEQILNLAGSGRDDNPASTQTRSSKKGHASSNQQNGTAKAQEYDAEADYNASESSQWYPFTDLIKRRFLWYYDSYLSSVDTWRQEQRDGTPFALAPFEGDGNSMNGSFEYESLRRRLERLKQALSDERKTWIEEGAKQVASETSRATQLAFTFQQLKYRWNESTYPGSRLEVSLPDKDNPFEWHLTMFGKPMTNLDGGVFNFSMTIPPDFPESWPRVYVDTPIYHHRVSKTKALCYFPEKPEDIESHLKAIVAAVEDEKPSYDPRTLVNPEAAALFWGGDDKRKLYNRMLRRSAQASSEF